MSIRTGALAVVVMLMLGIASPALAQNYVVNWVGATGYWDNPVMWNMGGGPDAYPDDTLYGTKYQCNLAGILGASAVIRDSVSVWAVQTDQNLKLAGGSVLTLTGDPPPASGLDAALVVGVPGRLSGNGYVDALSAANYGIITASQLGHVLDLRVDDLYNTGLVQASNRGELTIDGAWITNADPGVGGVMAAVDHGTLTIKGSHVENTSAGTGYPAGIYSATGGHLVLDGSVITGNRVVVAEAGAGEAGRMIMKASAVQAVDVGNGASLSVREGDSRITGPGTSVRLFSSSNLMIEEGARLSVGADMQVNGPASVAVWGGLEMMGGKIWDAGTLYLMGGTLSGTFQIEGTDTGPFQTTVYGFGTIDATDLELTQAEVDGSVPWIISDYSGETLTLRGTIRGQGQIEVSDGANLNATGAVIEFADSSHQLYLTRGSTGEVHDSLILATTMVADGSDLRVYNSTFYDDLQQTGPAVFVEQGVSGPSHLGIEAGYSHIANLQVTENCTLSIAPGARLEVDALFLGTDARCTVEGTIETWAGSAFWGSGDGQVVLNGGRIEGQLRNQVPLSGWGEIATTGASGLTGLTQQAPLNVEGGRLEIVPGALLNMETSWLTVAGFSELFVNDSVLHGSELMVSVMPYGVVRLNDATITGWGSINLGESVVQAPGGLVVPLSSGIEEEGAELIATGENSVDYGLNVTYTSQARIQSGTTRFSWFSNDGRVIVAPGATLAVLEPYGPTQYFENGGDIEVSGRLNVEVMNETVGYNEGTIDIRPGGTFDLIGHLDGWGDYTVAGDFHATNASLTDSGEIDMAGGTLSGSLDSRHSIYGYGTIRGSHIVRDAWIVAYTLGETLLITDAAIELQAADMDVALGASGGGHVKVQDAIITGSTTGRAMPEFWVYETFDNMPGSAMTFRDASVLVNGHVGDASLLSLFGAVTMINVDVHTGGTMNVFGDTAMNALGVGTMHPYTEQMGGGYAYVAPGAKLTVADVVTASAGGEQGILQVQGELHMRPSEAVGQPPMGPPNICVISGDGRVELAGGSITGDARVMHTGLNSIHGYGHISVGLTNLGAIYADVPVGTLWLDTNDMYNGHEGTITAQGAGRLAVQEIRIDNTGLIYVDPSSSMLVDAAIIDNSHGGTLTVDGMLELRRGGSIVNGPLALGAGSAASIGGIGQNTGGGPGPLVAYNEFQLPATAVGGSLAVINPAATGSGAPDTGDTILTVHGDLNTSGSVLVEQGARMDVLGLYRQTAGSTAVDGLVRLLGGSAIFDAGTLDIQTPVGGTIDLTTRALIVNYDTTSPLAQVTDWIRQGFNLAGGGNWDGPGITSADAAAQPDDLTAVGVLPNTDEKVGGKTTFEGEPVDATSILAAYTWWGDANLDGRIDANDYDVIDKNYLFTPDPDNMGWWTGDFNLDGVIDANDYDKIDRAFLFQTGPLGGGDDGGPATPTPEPATLILVVAGAMGLWSSRRRRA